ncbi:MAG: hypothetical protein Q3961_03120 [Bifidobacteriaceae bacterium]|nr:hypothetical protein [Bifidobacteriaceae bacterium]
MKIAPIFNPDVRKESPKPIQVDLRKTFTVGLTIWIVATLIVLGLITMFDLDLQDILVICVAGIICGALMLIWEHFDRWDYRRLGE